MSSDPAEAVTWHHGLIARWWAEFNLPEAHEVDYYAAAVRRYGEPALDLGCGTGRLLVPLLEQGLDVDGVDVSADMLAFASAAAARIGRDPLLVAQPLHELDLPRRYRTIYVCGVLGIGGRREHDREALARIHRHLEPDGALVLWHELPWAGLDPTRWARWLPGGRAGIPRDWPEAGDRRLLPDGDELELITRLVELDPHAQRQTLEIRARLWRGSRLEREESYTLRENLYFLPELLDMLAGAGFREVEVEAAYERRPATPDDDTLIVIARP